MIGLYDCLTLHSGLAMQYVNFLLATAVVLLAVLFGVQYFVDAARRKDHARTLLFMLVFVLFSVLLWKVFN